MNGCRQEALTIKMAREHAATPRRNTERGDDKGKRQEAAQHTRKKQITGWKSTAKALALAGNSTPALTHTHHRSAVSPRVRGFGPPHSKRTHRQQSTTNGRGREETHRHRLQAPSHGNGIRPQPAAGTQRTRSEQSPKEPHTRKRGLHPAMTRRLSPRGHTECTVSSIEIIRRPSLKNASVSDGP
ncbi:hypothetical protein TcCL_ESM06337 [Trypanosoma cruzi]|nr:hypothetical protein TcCL_ESM06337 [Trypanosoma cruzi]